MQTAAVVRSVFIKTTKKVTKAEMKKMAKSYAVELFRMFWEKDGALSEHEDHHEYEEFKLKLEKVKSEIEQKSQSAVDVELAQI